MTAARQPSPQQALRRLFLTLFLRGRTSRGLQKDRAPKSVGSKLGLALLLYAGIGACALAFQRQPVFALALYLHGMTLVFLGMTIASSAGEMLFNKEEADILLHRPVTPQTLLRARIGVLVNVSLWLAGAFNLTGFVVGIAAKDGGWLFPISHAISTAGQALFCTGCVVLAYELCLRWFGRERLEGLMTTVQIIVAVTVVIGGQIVPRLIAVSGNKMAVGVKSWWIVLLPPAWFAGFDDAVAGSGTKTSWLLAGVGAASTLLVLWLAFAKLARHYEEALQVIGEASAPKPAQQGRRRWLHAVVQRRPLNWWLREPVTRASFLLVAGYLLRDRETKLRIYPSLAPMLVMPFLFLLQERGRDGFGSGFGVAFSGAYIGLVALLGSNLLQFSQQWPAADVFRVAPIPGPSRICQGARRAVICFLALPTVAAFALIIGCLRHGFAQLPLLLPGLIAMPLFALYPYLGGKSVPLAMPSEDAKSASRGLQMVGVMMLSMALAGLALWSWETGWFHWLLLGEAMLASALYALMHRSVASAAWPAME
jgi:ABC-2 type transport system permease protein